MSATDGGSGIWKLTTGSCFGEIGSGFGSETVMMLGFTHVVYTHYTHVSGPTAAETPIGRATR